ncbi:MAG: ABC transporter permease [Bosea sp. (in: a-proteobacteria)]
MSGALPEMARPPTRGRLWRLADMVIDFARVIRRNIPLVREMALRDIKGGHAGHGLGSLWIYIQPIVVVATFMLIFGVVIGTKMAVTSTFPGDYTSYILVGLTPWLLMSNALGRATNAFITNANLVKQVVFPVETLPVATIVACFLIYVPTFILMVGYKALLGGGLGWLALALPLVLLMHALLCVGLTLLLSVTTPFLRDIREFVTIYMSVSMYFTPAIYLPDWVPSLVRPILYLNPFSYVVWVYQDVLFFGAIRHGFAWIVFAAMSIAIFLAGLVVFRRVKPYLGNVL